MKYWLYCRASHKATTPNEVSLAEAALVGKKDGIRVVRISAGQPSGKTIQRSGRGYPFTPVQQAAVIDNVMDV